MKRLILGLACVTAALAAPAAQTPVPAASEPHHKRLLYTNDVRVFDVVVPPGQSAADHVHEYDMATVVLGDGTLGISRNGQAVATTATGPGSVTIAEQSGAPATFRLENTGTTPLHLFEVENMREDRKWLTPPVLMAQGTTVAAQSRAFTVYDIRLGGDAMMTRHEHTWSTLAVLIDGTIEQGGIPGEEPSRLSGRGAWLTLPRGQAHTLAAVGGNAHVVEIEAR